MQVFRLVKPGVVDTVIAFDELPEALVANVKRGVCAGFPRHWKEFLGVKANEPAAQPFYLLDYMSRNSDRERWGEIVSYVKRNVDPSVRMLDKVEAMARPLAQDAYSDLTLEPEEVPIIPLPKREPALVGADEPEPKRRGRKPKEVAV